MLGYSVVGRLYQRATTVVCWVRFVPRFALRPFETARGRRVGESIYQFGILRESLRLPLMILLYRTYSRCHEV